MAINKVVYGNNTLLDLTSDTVTAATMLTGATAHDKSGEVINGTFAVEPNKTVTVAGNTVITPSSGYVEGDPVFIQSTAWKWANYAYTNTNSKMSQSYFSTFSPTKLVSGKTYKIRASVSVYWENPRTGDQTTYFDYRDIEEIFTWDGAKYTTITDLNYDLANNSTFVGLAIDSTYLGSGTKYPIGTVWTSTYSSSSAYYANIKDVSVVEVESVTYDAMSQVTVELAEGVGAGDVTQDAQGYVVLDDEGGGGNDVFVVNLTGQMPYNSTATMTMDKTASEVIDAFENNKVVLFVQPIEQLNGDHQLVRKDVIRMVTTDYALEYIEGDGIKITIQAIDSYTDSNSVYLYPASITTGTLSTYADYNASVTMNARSIQ